MSFSRDRNERPYDSRRSLYEDEAPPKGSSLWRTFWFIILSPFKLIGFLTRNLKFLIAFPVRILLSLVFVGILVGIILSVFYGTLASRYDMSEVVKMPERTIILDRKGREIGRLHGENRESVDMDRVPYYLFDAIIVREDKRFWDHGGVDWIGVARSLKQVIDHKRATQGASTLTMQLARNTYNLRERSLHRKLLEVALAKKIEASYSKKEILEAYLNRIFWGHTYMGLNTAARCYFSKTPEQLTLSESALLAGIVYGPNEFSPVKNPEGAKKVRNIVLKSMLEEKKIDLPQYEAALQEPVVVNQPRSRSEENYTMDIARRELERILEEEEIRVGGLIVQTTIDLDLQNAAIDALNKQLNTLEKAKGYKHQTKVQYESQPKETREKTTPRYIQGSVVVLDNVSGATLVLVGGRDAEESKFNRALQARRQIGSLFKPFVYATAFQRGLSPNSGVSDNRLVPGEVAKAGRWSPRNSDGRFLGTQPAWFGLVKSRNTMSVRIGQFAGMDNVIHSAQLSGFSGKITPMPASYLGTWEATPYEIASGYSSFANGGVRPTPYFIETIYDSNKRVLHFNQYSSIRVFSERAANQVTRILEKVTQPGGTAGHMKSLGFEAPCGGKTGTTDNYTNAWFAGFTSSLTGCVWVGMDQPQKTVDRGYGSTLALPVWAAVMQAAKEHEYPCGNLRMKAGVKGGGVLLCRESGMLAHSGCKTARTSYVETMLNQVPSGFCQKHALEAEVVGEGEETGERAVDAEVIYDPGTAPHEPSMIPGKGKTTQTPAGVVPAEVVYDVVDSEVVE